MDITLQGWLTTDSRVKQTKKGKPFTTFGFAAGPNKLFWVVEWDTDDGHLRKGDRVEIDGVVEKKSYVDADGTQKQSFNITATRVRRIKNQTSGEADGLSEAEKAELLALAI